ncbi:MAG: trypsin-like peptidase domain-containing protein [Eubacteriales bacterium]
MKLKKLFCFIAASIFLILPFSTALAAEQTDTRTMAMINKPGVVLIYTTWSADVIIPEFNLDETIYSDMDANIQEQVDAGTMNPNDPTNFVSAYMNLLTDWLPYYTVSTGKDLSKTASVSYVGSGFIVTPDGYIVTNAHVVTTDETAMKVQFASDTTKEIVDTDIQGLVDSLTKTYKVSPTDDQIQKFYNMYYDFYASNMQVSNLKGDFQCLMGNVSPGSDVSAKALTMDLRKKGEPIPGKDIAILKIDKANLPTVTLGDDAALKTGDQVYAMGYPAITTVNSDVLNIEQAISEPTLTSGIISAKKQMSGGWSVLQTDADIHGGNSGGPLFNSKGEVIGINTFGMIDKSGAESSGSNFAIPISIAKQFLNELNVKPAESDFTKQYIQAVNLYNKNDYKGALEILRTINEINPGYPVIADLLSECSSKALTQSAAPSESQQSSQAAQEPVSAPATPAGNNTMMIIIIVVVAAAAVVVVVLLLLAKKKKTPVAPAAAPSQPAVTPSKPAEPAAQPATQFLCPGCKKPIDPKAKFCPECGEVLTAFCKNCGAKLEPGAKFCPECGKKTNE